jgi:hypothetical protein
MPPWWKSLLLQIFPPDLIVASPLKFNAIAGPSACPVRTPIAFLLQRFSSLPSPLSLSLA